MKPKATSEKIRGGGGERPAPEHLRRCRWVCLVSMGSKFCNENKFVKITTLITANDKAIFYFFVKGKELLTTVQEILIKPYFPHFSKTKKICPYPPPKKREIHPNVPSPRHISPLPHGTLPTLHKHAKILNLLEKIV